MGSGGRPGAPSLVIGAAKAIGAAGSGASAARGQGARGPARRIVNPASRVPRGAGPGDGTVPAAPHVGRTAKSGALDLALAHGRRRLRPPRPRPSLGRPAHTSAQRGKEPPPIPVSAPRPHPHPRAPASQTPPTASDPADSAAHSPPATPERSRLVQAEHNQPSFRLTPPPSGGGDVERRGD